MIQTSIVVQSVRKYRNSFRCGFIALTEKNANEGELAFEIPNCKFGVSCGLKDELDVAKSFNYILQTRRAEFGKP
jgi:hypothetical protein